MNKIICGLVGLGRIGSILEEDGLREKPLAKNSSDGLEIVNIHNSGKLKILINHERRYSKDYLIAKKRIEKKTLGELLSISAKLYMGRNNPVHDVLLHDGTHFIDIIRFLTSSSLKMLKTEKIIVSNKESLFIISETMDRAENVPVQLEIGSGRNYIVFELDLVFSAGRIRIGNGLYEEYVSERSPYYEKMNSLARINARRPEITGYFRNMLIDAVRCVREDSRMPLSSAADGYEALLFIDSVKNAR